MRQARLPSLSVNAYPEGKLKSGIRHEAINDPENRSW